jgi:KUP system potassium uptake protein
MGKGHYILVVVLFGTCIVTGDDALAPKISILSAASGVRVNISSLDKKYIC